MLNRNVVLVFSVLLLLAEADVELLGDGPPAASTDKDSTSDEAPTESMNVVSPGQPDVFQHYGSGPSDAAVSSVEAAETPTSNQMTAPEPVAVAASSVEDDEDEGNDSGEHGKTMLNSRSAKAQNPHSPQSPAHSPQIPALPPQPIIPQPKVLVRSRTSKRRSRTNRRQI